MKCVRPQEKLYLSISDIFKFQTFKSLKARYLLEKAI